MANKNLRVIARICFFYFCGTTAVIMLTIIASRHFDLSQFQQPVSDGSILPSKPPRPRRRTVTTKNPLLVTPEPVKEADMPAIGEYQSLEEKWCRERIANKSGINLCPCIPQGLQGRVMVNMIDSNWKSISEIVGADVRMGGEWMPDNCVPHTRLAIIIPCRDRDSHLRILLRHLYPILKRQQLHFRIFVVDQRLPMVFNKAAIMNIGFLEAQKRFLFDCVIFHDVDMLLEDDRALMTCGPNPRHYVRALDRWKYHFYPTFGGVVSLTADMFRRVNGYSLKYFGWGGEDDDMWSRVGRLWRIFGIPTMIGRYSSISHNRDATNRRNPSRHSLIGVGYKQNKNKSIDGLSGLVYDVNGVELKPLFTRFEVDINTTVLHYPQHKTFRYRRMNGFCLDSDVILTSNSVSWTSCRFQCDTHVGQPCFGFSHAPGKCTLIRAICNLSPVAGSRTYVKDPEQVTRKPKGPPHSHRKHK